MGERAQLEGTRTWSILLGSYTTEQHFVLKEAMPLRSNHECLSFQEHFIVFLVCDMYGMYELNECTCSLHNNFNTIVYPLQSYSTYVDLVGVHGILYVNCTYCAFQ